MHCNHPPSLESDASSSSEGVFVTPPPRAALANGKAVDDESQELQSQTVATTLGVDDESDGEGCPLQSGEGTTSKDTATSSRGSRKIARGTKRALNNLRSSKLGGAATARARLTPSKKSDLSTEPKAKGKRTSTTRDQASTGLRDTVMNGKALSGLPDNSARSPRDSMEIGTGDDIHLPSRRKDARDNTAAERVNSKEQNAKYRPHIHSPSSGGREATESGPTELLAEQDKAIEQLQSALTVMKQEHESTMAHFKSALAEESKSKAFWAHKHEEVHREYMKTESEKRMLQAKMTERDAQWKREWERKNEHLLRDLSDRREEADASRKLAWGHEQEAQELRRQVLDLKHSISLSTRMEGQITDDVFRERMRTLGHDLQNWTINNFRRAKLQVSNLSDEVRSEVYAAVSGYDTLAHTSRLAVIQAIVTKKLVDDIFASYFVGLPKECLSHLQWTERYLGDAVPASKVNEWRSGTLTILRQVMVDKPDAPTEMVISRLQERITLLLTTLISSDLSETCSRGLTAILRSATQSSWLFRSQRARFKIEVASAESEVSNVFDHEFHEDIGGHDERELKGKAIDCTTFPCVIKLGDENGDKLHLRNIIVKANVLCHTD
ncbi:MAG: hypothetical protein M1833_000851 [Piccolia ochrophora]|nr:MAG: hypothetical protein M1833_000851 [Piccolia ochrophora]